MKKMWYSLIQLREIQFICVYFLLESFRDKKVFRSLNWAEASVVVMIIFTKNIGYKLDLFGWFLLKWLEKHRISSRTSNEWKCF